MIALTQNLPIPFSKQLKNLWHRRFWKRWCSDDWELFIVLIVSLTLLFSTSVGLIISDNQFNERLALAAKQHVFKVGQSAFCDVFPHDDDQDRLWMPCRVIAIDTTDGVGWYQVSYRDPHGGAPNSDNIRVLDMKEKL